MAKTTSTSKRHRNQGDDQVKQVYYARYQQIAKEKCQTYVRTQQVKEKSTRSLREGSPDVTIHAGVCRPMRTLNFQGYRHFLTLTLARQRYKMLYLLKQRSEIEDHCQELIACIEQNTQMKVRRFHLDKAPEFLSLRKVFNKIWITLTKTSIYTPSPNG